MVIVLVLWSWLGFLITVVNGYWLRFDRGWSYAIIKFFRPVCWSIISISGMFLLTRCLECKLWRNVLSHIVVVGPATMLAIILRERNVLGYFNRWNKWGLYLDGLEVLIWIDVVVAMSSPHIAIIGTHQISIIWADWIFEAMGVLSSSWKAQIWVATTLLVYLDVLILDTLVLAVCSYVLLEIWFKQVLWLLWNRNRSLHPKCWSIIQVSIW